MTALVIAEHDNVALKSGVLAAVTAAIQCAAEVHVLVVGHNCSAAAQAAAQLSGVAKVLVADAPQFENGQAECVAEQALALATSYTHILAPATAFGKSLLPRVAARLDVAQISEVSRVVAGDTFERAIYAGNAIATVRSADVIKVLTVRATGFAAADMAGSAEILPVDCVTETSAAGFISRDLAQSERPELESAKVVVSGGRGLGSRENFKLLEPLADRLGGGLGASRAAVDAGYAPNDWQVGQTGKVVAPQLYIAVGISGAIQHLAGMKDSKVIVAINKDPEAPIFSVSDYGIVGDLFEVVPQLERELAA